MCLRKGYLPQFTEEVFRVTKVIRNHRPYRYELEDLMGEAIAGRFASEEVQKVIKDGDALWKIEKIIRPVRRHNRQQYLVKWRGFPAKFNSLVSAEDITKVAPERAPSPAPSEEL